MRVMLDVLSGPIRLWDHKPTVLCIENKAYFRDFVQVLLEGDTEEHNIVFSENFEPIKYRTQTCLIQNFHDLNFSSAFMKKVYDDMALFCVNEISDESINLQEVIFAFTDLLIQNYDFDFTGRTEFYFQDFFKMMNIKPDFQEQDLLGNLFQYVLLVQKYSPVKLFIFVNLHTYFSEAELNTFFKEMSDRHIRIMDIESNSSFDRNENENITIIDKDLCEIIESGENLNYNTY